LFKKNGCNDYVPECIDSIVPLCSVYERKGQFLSKHCHLTIKKYTDIVQLLEKDYR